MLHPLYPGERVPGTHWIGVPVGPQIQSGCCRKEKISYPCLESNPSHPAHSPLLYQLSYSSSFHFRALVPKVGCTIPQGGLRGKGALEVGPSKSIVRLFTIHVTLRNWYLLKPIHCIKNLLTVKYE
jgi:hypothetical protein